MLMAPGRYIAQNVRPRKASVEDEEEDLRDLSDEDLESPEDAESEDLIEIEDDEDEHSEASEDEDEEESDDDQAVGEQLSTVSFGTLKQAQDALSRKRKRGSDITPDLDEKLDALRERLRTLKRSQPSSKGSSAGNVHSAHTTTKPRKRSETDAQGNEASSDPDSPPSEEDAQPHARSSKHAPTSQSSKHQVTRKRAVVDLPRRPTLGDPRFSALQHSSSHNSKSSDKDSAYSFLLTYQKDEIAALKAAIKAPSTSPADRETLQRKLHSMENRLKAREAQEREREVVRQHRREERDRVKEGKTPYYLKKGEVKRRVLIQRFEGMKGKEREKALEKRRMREGQRERKRMPVARRRVPEGDGG